MIIGRMFANTVKPAAGPDLKGGHS